MSFFLFLFYFLAVPDLDHAKMLAAAPLCLVSPLTTVTTDQHTVTTCLTPVYATPTTLSSPRP